MATAHTIEGFLDNRLLIAMPGMQDDNFARSVTLLCQHSAEGALGITINRPSDCRLGQIFEQLEIPCADSALCEQPVLDGGPVHRDRGFVLHTPSATFESTLELRNDLMVTTSADVLAAIAAQQGPDRYLVALGCAGWTDGQLEDEMRQNAWLSSSCDPGIIFDAPLDQRWQRAVASLGIDTSQLHDVGGHA